MSYEENPRVAELRERLASITGTLRSIHSAAGDRSLSAREQKAWDRAAAERAEVEQELTELTERLAEVERLSQLPGHTLPGDDRGPRAGYEPGASRSAAMRAVDHWVRSDRLTAAAAEKVEAALATHSSDRTLAERYVAATADPAYLSAFLKGLRSDGKGHLLWTSEESEAYRRVEAVAAEMRAMAVGTSSVGGLQVPVIVNPAVQLSGDGSISPMRQLANVISVVGISYKPVTSAGVTASWDTEGSEVSDDTPTLASPEVKSFTLRAFVPFSFEYDTSVSGGAAEQLLRLLNDAYDQLTASAFWSGNGTSAPQGLWTGVDGGDSELDPATAETFASADVYATQNALPARFQPNATWQAAIGTINTLSQAETSNGAPLFPRVGDANPVLLRKPLYENSLMPSVADINASATADNPVLAYGDIRQAYTIVDFLDSRVELVQHLFGSNNRPTGQRGLLLWARVGAAVVMDEAVRILNVATAA